MDIPPGLGAISSAEPFSNPGRPPDHSVRRPFDSGRLCLLANKFNDGIATIDSRANARQPANELRNKLSIVDVADPDPKNRRSISLGCAYSCKVAVFGDENVGSSNRLIANLSVCACCESEISNMHRFVARPAQGVSQRFRLRIDEKAQAYSAAMIG